MPRFRPLELKTKYPAVRRLMRENPRLFLLMWRSAIANEIRQARKHDRDMKGSFEFFLKRDGERKVVKQEKDWLKTYGKDRDAKSRMADLRRKLRGQHHWKDAELYALKAAREDPGRLEVFSAFKQYLKKSKSLYTASSRVNQQMADHMGKYLKGSEIFYDAAARALRYMEWHVGQNIVLLTGRKKRHRKEISIEKEAQTLYSSAKYITPKEIKEIVERQEKPMWQTTLDNKWKKKHVRKLP